MVSHSPFSSADPPVTDDHRLVAYRCACGTDVLVHIGGRGICHHCGQPIYLAGFDKAQTVSFGADPHSGSGIQLADGPDRSGERLGHFRLMSRIGSGGMGAVYRALDESLQRFVAVKLIRSAERQEGVTAKEIGRLLHEAIAQARLNHPNVVTIYYVGRQEEEPFFAMELLPGPTLHDVLREGALPFAEVIHYARQITSALSHAARLGLIHGDIKPSNLILAGGNQVKLSDFGLATTETTDLTGGLSGTITHMAPELLTRGATPTIFSDMYSLGVTLFELTFGTRPYQLTGGNLMEQLASRRTATVSFPTRWPDSVPRGWRDVLSTLMAPQPTDRFPNYEELSRAIEQYAPVGATPASLFSRGFALAIDYSILFACLLPFLIPAALVSEPRIAAELPSNAQAIVERFRFLALLGPLVPLAATWAEWHGWRTVGRYLFQLRVVDPHGLKLSRGRRTLRALFRYIPLWVVSFSAVAYASGFDLIALMLAPVDEIVLMLDTIPVLFPGRRALHDRLVGSRVVLDTRHERLSNTAPP
ncbi:MAG: hypothetical protein KatS3mg111_1609 [Pirellulaceae bacterium]|nr:MAG: hypothetical protein KatS3mg111_1609 [Pirellulaceae bacterium]